MERFLIFISYRRGESAGYAGRLHESLERRFGDGHVFRDVDELEPGQDFVDAISTRLRDCGACLVMIGSEWLLVTDRTGRRRLEQANDYVRLEIEAALARKDLLVVPVLVEGAAMPAAEDLPASMRALSRRHALSLRDETWDSDVERLVTILEKTIGRRTIAGDISTVSRLPRLVPAKYLAWLGLAVASLVLVVMFMMRSRDIPAPEAITATPGAGSSEAAGVRAGATARAIALPRLAEAAHGRLIYAVLSGDIASNGSTSTLRLRIRLSNEGRYPANFWDASFRLAMQGETVAPTSGLNDLVNGHSIQQGIITFDLPAGAAHGALQIIDQNGIAEIPLDLTATNAPSVVDTTDTGDALSRAHLAAVTTDPVALVKGDVAYTLDRMTARRFTNTLRIVATVRVANNGQYSRLFDSSAIRLLIDGQLFAPFEYPVMVVEPSSATSGDFLFDAPRSARRVTVRVVEPKADAAFDLPSLQ